MPPDLWQYAFEAAVALLLLLGGWLFRTLQQAVSDLQSKVESFENSCGLCKSNLPTAYVPRDQYTSDVKWIRDALARIEKKVDQ